MVTTYWSYKSRCLRPSLIHRLRVTECERVLLFDTAMDEAEEFSNLIFVQGGPKGEICEVKVGACPEGIPRWLLGLTCLS
jgi:hypothetical protein